MCIPLLLQNLSVVAKMRNECTLRIFCLCLSIALWSHARPASSQDTGYDDFLQRIRDGHAPIFSNHTSPDWVYKSQSSAFEEALRKGKMTFINSRSSKHECSPLKVWFFVETDIHANKGLFEIQKQNVNHKTPLFIQTQNFIFTSNRYNIDYKCYCTFKILYNKTLIWY